MAYSIEEMFGVKGRKVIVTGGTSGIGREIAIALAELGAQVAIIGRTKERMDSTLAELKKRNPTSLGFLVDVYDTEGMKKAYAEVAAAFGTIDGLVNSAGILHIEGLDTISEETFKKVFDINVKGTILSCKLAGEYMLKNGYGSIVNISSVSTARGKSFYTSYASSKAAIDGFTRALGTEWIRKGINVNSVAPGLVLTEINRQDAALYPHSVQKRIDSIPRGKAGEPSSIVGPVIALLSPATNHMVGQTIFVDGGFTVGDMFVMRVPKEEEEN